MLRQLVCVFVALHCATAELFCERGYSLVNDRCYRFDAQALATYDEALSACAGANGNLASIHDDAANDYIKTLDASGVRIGLKYDTSAKSFTWSDGSSFDYDKTDPNFASWSQYFGYCAINENGVWKNAECTDKLKFVCSKKASDETDPGNCPDPSKIYTTPVTISSPGYPEKYDLHANRINCIYKIAAPAGQQVKISFDNVTLDQNEGYLAVYKTYDDDFSYFQADNDFNGLYVIVENDLPVLQLVGSLKGKYRLTVTAVDPEPAQTPNNVCPDKYRVYPIPYMLYSPGYPDYFDLPDTKLQCIYLLAGKIGYGIRVYVAAVDDNADYGYMYVYTSWSQALSFADSNDGYDKRGAGETHNYTATRFGMDMSHRYPGRFALDFSAFDPKQPDKIIVH